MAVRDDAEPAATTPRLPYVQSIAGCLPGAIGAYGLSEAELASWLAKLAPHLSRLADDDALNRLPLLLVPEETADIDQAAAALRAEPALAALLRLRIMNARTAAGVQLMSREVIKGMAELAPGALIVDKEPDGR